MPDDWRPGYPIDLRSSRRIARLVGTPLGDFEGAAGRVVARRTGERVVLQDDGTSHRMPDIRIDYPDDVSAFVEVTADLDPSYGAMQAALRGHGWQADRPALDRVWWLTLSGECNVGRLAKVMEPILAGMAAAGELYEWASDNLDPDAGDGVRQLIDLGVVGLSSRACRVDERGMVHLLPDGIIGPPTIDWPVVSDWVDAAMHSEKLADVRAKLDATGAAERHLFFGSTFTSPGDIWFALSLEERGLPQRPPALPPEITHLWISQVPMVGRCLAWFPRIGWHDVMYHWATE